MSQNKSLTFKETLITNIENFFRTKRILLWIILAAFVGLIIFFIVYNAGSKNILEVSTKAVEDVDKKFSDWLNETDEAKKTELEKEITNGLSTIIAKYPHSYAAQRALFTRGHYYIKKKEWENAAKDYLTLTESFPKSVLAEESLLNAASCNEELSNFNEAISLHKEFQSQYPNSFKIAYSLFSTGRIFEQTKNYTEAGKIYEKMESDYLNSGWTKLAQNRLIDLKASDLYKKEQ